MNHRQLNKILKKLTLEDLKSLLNKKIEQLPIEIKIWSLLEHLGGEKSDTYVKVTNSYGKFEVGQYCRVRENPSPSSSYIWIQDAEDVKEQKKDLEKYGLNTGGSGLPMNEKEFEIVWKDGKPV